MIHQRWRVCLWLGAALVLADTLADAAPNPNASSGGETLWRWQGRYVRIVPQDTSDAPPNDHPARLTPQELAPLLTALQVTRPTKRRFNRKISEHHQLPVFGDQELETLARALSRGLARAGPRQDIVFFITGDHDAGVRGMFKNHDVNTARAFLRDGKLNLIFGEVHGSYSGRAVADTGSRRSTADPPWVLVTAEGIRYHTQGDRVRRDWVVIDPSAVLEQYRRRGWQIPAVGAGPVGGGSATPDPTAADARPSVTTHLAAQLRVLKDLRGQGLITEEIYKERVHRLLDEQLPQRSPQQREETRP